MIFIILGVAVALFIGAMTVYKKNKKSKSVPEIKPKKLPEGAVEPRKKSIKLDTHAPVVPADPTVGGKKLKKKKSAAKAEKKGLTAAEKEELAETEQEVGIEKKQFICVVHKGPIEGANIYLCPKCKTFYCQNCAKVLKVKGEKCWSCESDIKIDLSESERQKISEEIPKEDQEKVEDVDIQPMEPEEPENDLDEQTLPRDGDEDLQQMEPEEKEDNLDKQSSPN